MINSYIGFMFIHQMALQGSQLHLDKMTITCSEDVSLRVLLEFFVTFKNESLIPRLYCVNFFSSDVSIFAQVFTGVILYTVKKPQAIKSRVSCSSPILHQWNVYVVLYGNISAVTPSTPLPRLRVSMSESGLFLVLTTRFHYVSQGV